MWLAYMMGVEKPPGIVKLLKEREDKVNVEGKEGEINLQY